MPPPNRQLREFQKWYEWVTRSIYNYAQALGFDPTWQQMQLFDAVMDGTDKLACRSGQGPGKTTAMQAVAGYLTLRSPYSRTFITAPSMRQCRDVFLAEMQMRHLQAPDPQLRRCFDFLKGSVGCMGMDSTQWGISCVTASSPEAIQGMHREDMTIIVEEASGVEDNLLQALLGTKSGPKNRLYLIGNPNSRVGMFHDIHTKPAFVQDGWLKLHWNAEETPESKWFTKARNKTLETLFGRDSDAYRVRVMGEFPRAEANGIIDPDALKDCMKLERMAQAIRSFSPNGKLVRQFGIDFARFGSDESAVFRRSGNAIVEWKAYQKREPVEVVEEAFKMQSDAGWSSKDALYIADAGGMGQGVMFKFAQAERQHYEFHSNGRSGSEDYHDAMSEAWFSLAKRIKDRKVYLPDDNRLYEQLTTRRYHVTKKGKLMVESKDDYCRRGFDSPDRADGCVMAFYDSAVAEGRTASVPAYQPDRQGQRPGLRVGGNSLFSGR